MYNNVPCVGHCHPRVAQAIALQARSVNVNMRYLHGGAVSLAERLLQSMNGESPGGDAGLDTVLFCNSGSEANDLAVRLARSFTKGSGSLCTHWAYHGITAATVALSPETAAIAGHLPEDVERWQPPDHYRGLYLDSSEFLAALGRLEQKGHKLACAILDPVLCSERILDLDPVYAQSLLEATHDHGGLWIADEVQSGHGRTGSHMWAFARLGLRPDLVTLGKPMGNGHPVAAVVTRREIAQAFIDKEGVFFSTFGGNPVSAAAGHAVLDVIEDERVLERVVAAGKALRAATLEVTKDCPRVGDVRGVGLVNSVEFVTDPHSKEPDMAAAQAVRSALRARGVLVGTTGQHSNCLKIRPPLAFTDKEVPVWAEALSGAIKDAGLYFHN
jgi:4-aminobutyrate aminotransferase-like enzyme